jgi:NADPH-dependent 7-cyano-7-deazaguanine reductase QueF
MYWAMCDLVDYSNVNNVQMQLIDIIMSDVKNSNKPMYVKVNKKRFSSINMEFKQDPNKEEDPTAIDITCILHFRKA